MSIGTMLIAPAFAAAASPSAYSLTGSIAGPDGGGWDYALVNPVAHRLYVAHATSVSVFDTARGKAIGS